MTDEEFVRDDLNEVRQSLIDGEIYVTKTRFDPFAMVQGSDGDEESRDVREESNAEAFVDDNSCDSHSTEIDENQEYSKHLNPVSIRLRSASVLLDFPLTAKTDVFACRFSPDDTMLACGCGDGRVRLFSVRTGRLAYQLNIGTFDNLPTTCIRFRRRSSNNATENVLVTADADGFIKHWHVTTQQLLHSTREEDNQIYAIDFNSTGDMYATAGRDGCIRLYDETAKSRLATLTAGLHAPGHSSRVYSLKFIDSNILISGGWDNTVHIWDVRAGHAQRVIYGPHIAGDSIDYQNGMLVTGSYRYEESLQFWDFQSGKLVTTAPSVSDTMIYSVQFNPTRPVIVAGGVTANTARWFSLENPSKVVPIGEGHLPLNNGIYSVAYSSDGNSVALAGKESSIRIYKCPSIQ